MFVIITIIIIIIINVVAFVATFLHTTYAFGYSLEAPLLGYFMN